MTLWFCDNCPFNEKGCGPWDDNDESFENTKKAHRDHLGFQKDKQVKTIDYDSRFFDWQLHELIAECKGPEKVCLIRERWKWISRA